jgi:hypothetical protein
MNAPMNRAQRRAMKKGRGATEYRDVPLPAALDEFTVFDMTQTLLNKISNGAIEAYRGEPVFRDNAGQLCYVCPALKGWVETWELINDQLGTNINLYPLRRIHNKLDAGMILAEGEISAAKDTLLSMRLVFRAADRSRIASIARSAQIKILLEDRAP